LIDFGYAQRYWEADKHIEPDKHKGFVGNFAFASHNAFKPISQSRRDDFVSICYLLVYLFNGEPNWMYKISQGPPIDVNPAVAAVKKSMTPKRLCVGSSKRLIDFTREVFSY
jgi:hypothetical protein